jgi:hypothetical protein
LIISRLGTLKPRLKAIRRVGRYNLRLILINTPALAATPLQRIS